MSGTSKKKMLRRKIMMWTNALIYSITREVNNKSFPIIFFYV